MSQCSDFGRDIWFSAEISLICILRYCRGRFTRLLPVTIECLSMWPISLFNMRYHRSISPVHHPISMKFDATSLLPIRVYHLRKPMLSCGVISIVPCYWVNLHSFRDDLYDHFAVYFITLCSRTLTSWFTVTIAVASPVFYRQLVLIAMALSVSLSVCLSVRVSLRHQCSGADTY